jgi:hypothetical protein
VCEWISIEIAGIRWLRSSRKGTRTEEVKAVGSTAVEAVIGGAGHGALEAELGERSAVAQL